MTTKQPGDSRNGPALPEFREGIAMNDPSPLVVIPKSKTRCIFVQLVTFKGVTRLDMREHYRDENGDWAPTRQGIGLSCDERVDLLVDAIRLAQEYIAREVKP